MPPIELLILLPGIVVFLYCAELHSRESYRTTLYKIRLKHPQLAVDDITPTPELRANRLERDVHNFLKKGRLFTTYITILVYAIAISHL